MKRWVKWTVGVGLALGVGIGGFYWRVSAEVQRRLQQTIQVAVPELDSVADADVELGKRIVTIRNGCVDCHGANLAGATVMADAVFAHVDAPNLTPLALAEWTDGEIARAVRHGVGRDGRPLFLMPSHEYVRLSRGDLTAIVAYLRSLEPREGKTSRVDLGPGAKMLMYLDKVPTFLPAETMDHGIPFVDKPAEAVSVDFGKYLVESACVGCHGPGLAGGPIPGGDPSWPPASDLTPRSLGTWSAEDFRKAMVEGVSKDGRKIRPPMPLALTAQMSDTERDAIWAYLSSLPSKDEVARD